MNKDNIVFNNTVTRNNFNNLLKKFGHPTITDNTIHKMFSKLNKLELLSVHNKRGTYQVDPLYFFNGEENRREKLIRKNLEKLNQEPINKLRHKRLSKNRR